jgi:Double-stranded RNA binding motif.
MMNTTEMNNTIFESATHSQGLKTQSVFFPINGIRLTPIARFNELIQSKGITRVVEEYETTQWNERPSWSYQITIVYFNKTFFGEGVAMKKQEAKHKACSKLFEHIEEDKKNSIVEVDPEIEELLVRAGVEQNPGPTIKIPRVLASITEYHDFNELHTKYGLKIKFNKHQHSTDEESVYIKVTEEQKEQILHALDNKLSTRILATITLESLQKVYSNHTNFAPELRIIIKPDKNLCHH